MKTELKPIFDNHSSFYGKATVESDSSVPNLITLRSYGTIVAEITGSTPRVFDTYSATTLRHIKEFLKQNNFKAESKKQIIKDYSI